MLSLADVRAWALFSTTPRHFGHGQEWLLWLPKQAAFHTPRLPAKWLRWQIFSYLDVFIFLDKIPSALSSDPPWTAKPWGTRMDWISWVSHIAESYCPVLHASSAVLLSRVPIQKGLALMTNSLFHKIISLCQHLSFLGFKHKYMGPGEQHHAFFSTFCFFPSVSNRISSSV